MSKSSFIVYTFIYIGISCFFIFKGGPSILNSGKRINTQPKRLKEVEMIGFNYHVASKSYLNVKIRTKAEEINLQFYIPDNEHKELLDVLEKNNLVTIEDKFLEYVPISFDKEQLSFMDNIEVIYKNEELRYLAIDNQRIIGSRNVIRKIVTIGLGYFMIVLGILGLIIFPLNVYIQIKENENEPFYVPNRFDGLKYILRLFSK